MSAFNELRTTGSLGEAGVRLLYSTVRRVAKRFPPPDGGPWTREKSVEAAHDFLVARPERMTALYLKATDDDSLERLLYTAVVRHFQSEGRRTERAKLLRRLSDVLEGDDEFVQVGGPGTKPRRWALRSHLENADYTGGTRVLITAAWEAPDVHISRWRSDARTYISDRQSLVAFAKAVLDAARGPLELSVLAEVAAHRFELRDVPLLLDIDDVPHLAPTTPPAEDRAVAGLRAAAAWAQLTERERAALPYIDGSVRDAGAALGVGRTTAAALLRQLRAILADTIGDDATALVALQEMATDRTPAPDGTSNREGG